jgi:transcriptional regulator with XRE-family HTH domain
VKRDKNLVAAGIEIKRLRHSRGLSQEQLAELAGLHRNYIGLVERGERNATLKALLAVAESLDVTIGELLAGVPRRMPSERDP